MQYPFKIQCQHLLRAPSKGLNGEGNQHNSQWHARLLDTSTLISLYTLTKSMELNDSVSFSHIPREVSPLSSGRAEDGSKNSDGYGDQPPGGDDEMKELPEMTEDISKEQSGSILSRWWPEFIACAIAVAAFCALIGTVYPYQGQPLPRWPYGLGINTLISIYTVIFEMATVMVVSSGEYRCGMVYHNPHVPVLTMTGLGQLKFLWFQSSRKLSDLGTFDQGGRGAWGALLLIWRLRTR